MYVTDDNKTYLGLHIKCLMFLFDFNWIWIFSTDIYKIPNNKFHRNPFIEICTDTYWQMNRCTGMLKLIGAF